MVILRRSCSLTKSSMSVQDGMSRDGALFRRHNVKTKRSQQSQSKKSMRSVLVAGSPGTPDALEAVGGGVAFDNSTVGADQSGAVIKIYGMRSQFDSGLKVICYTKEKKEK